MRLVRSEQMPWEPDEISPREGKVDWKQFAEGESSKGTFFSFFIVKFRSGEDAYSSPRHHHTFEQIRFVLDGTANIAKGKDLPEGWLGYFPAGAFYGPQRNEGGTVVLYVQFGPGYLAQDDRVRAMEELRESGEFHDGVYSSVDSVSGKRRNSDGMEALWEHVHREPLEYPRPRYPEPVFIDPSAFAWRDSDVAGVERKHLGTFTESEVAISMLRWVQPATVALERDRSQLVYALGGEMTVDGRLADKGTAVWSETGDETMIAGTSGAELMVWQLP